MKPTTKISDHELRVTKADESHCPLSPGSEWLPIATAPKDGTEIIVGYDFATVWIAHVAFYSTGTVEATDGTIVELWRDQGHDSQDDAEGWWSYVENSVSQHKLEGHNTPTHWIPLPPLPNNEVRDSAANTEQGK